MSGILPGLSIVAGKLRDLASDIVTVRTGTVVSNFAPMSQTLVTLDNDPESATVQSLALNGPLGAGARVMCIAYPPRGLVIIGLLSPFAPQQLVVTATGSVTAAQVAGYQYAKFRTQGGGGSGGGAAATAGGESSAGGGGQGGHYAENLIDLSTAAFPIAAAIGAGGTGVSGATGNAGGTTSFTDANAVVLCSSGGGAGGGASAAGTIVAPLVAGGNGALASMVGSVQVKGTPGGSGIRIAAAVAFSGYGGSSHLGGGAPPSPGANFQGLPGGQYGGGGSGSSRGTAQTALAGGPGFIGVGIVELM